MDTEMNSSQSQQQQNNADQLQERQPTTQSSSTFFFRSTDDDRFSSNHLASQIHKIIRDGDYARLPDMVTSEKANVLWESNSSGWTALHFAASHFLPLEWWKWILDRACEPFASTKRVPLDSVRNNVGESIVDVYFRSFLAPLPWQSTQVKNASLKLLQAITIVCKDSVLIRQMRREMEDLSTTKNQSVWRSRPSHDNNRNVTRCVSFCHNLKILCQAAETGQVQGSATYDFSRVIFFLAQTGGCPEPFARLAMALYPEQAAKRMRATAQSISNLREGTCQTPPLQYPLHMWCASHSYCPSVMNGMMKPLLRAFPQAAMTPDTSGRYPLHYACLAGKTWDEMKPLFDAAPFVLERLDPVTKLYPFAIVAMVSNPNCQEHMCQRYTPHAAEVLARQESAGAKGLASLWYIMPMKSQEEARQQTAVTLSCKNLSSIYSILRHHPRALPVPACKFTAAKF